MFKVPGEPAPWLVYTRAALRRGSDRSPGIVRLKVYQGTIQAYIKQHMPPEFPLDGPLSVDIIVSRSHPKDPTKKPDRLNYGKGIEDAMEGLAYYNDSQIVTGNVEKEYCGDGQEPHTWIVITSLEDQ